MCILVEVGRPKSNNKKDLVFTKLDRRPSKDVVYVTLVSWAGVGGAEVACVPIMSAIQGGLKTMSLEEIDCRFSIENGRMELIRRPRGVCG
jgi:hypothetical protein